MARPRKQGLGYFPFECDFFADERMVAIAGEFGLKGEIITIHLLCAVYRNGYFAEWGDLMKFKLLKELPGVSVELLEQVVSRLVRWGLFDEGLFSSVGVLTSEEIQRTYFGITRGRVQTEGIPHILGFSQRNQGGIENTPQKGFYVRNPRLGAVSYTETPVSYVETPQIKENKSKETDYVGKEKPPPPDVENFSGGEPVSTRSAENAVLGAKSCAGGAEYPASVKLTGRAEKTPQTAVNGFLTKRPFEDNVAECMQSQEWQEMALMSLNLTKIDWKEAFSAFRASLVANGHETAKSRQDFRQHFVNWLRIQHQSTLNQRNQNQKNGNNNNPKGVVGDDRAGGGAGFGRPTIAPAAVVPAGRGKSCI